MAMTTKSSSKKMMRTMKDIYLRAKVRETILLYASKTSICTFSLPTIYICKTFVEEDNVEENDVEETQDESSSIPDVPDLYDKVYSNMPEETHTLNGEF